MTATIRLQDSTCYLEGELSFAHVPSLEKQKLPEGSETLDLSKVSRLDSAGVALLIHWQTQAQAAKRKLVLQNIPDQLQHYIDLCELESVFGESAPDSMPTI